MNRGFISRFNESDTTASGMIEPVQPVTDGTPGGLIAQYLRSNPAQCRFLALKRTVGEELFIDVFIGNGSFLGSVVTALGETEEEDIQSYVRVGEDGRIFQVTAEGRTYPAATGGISGLSEAVDLTPTRRMSIDRLVNNILDLPAVKGVWGDQDEIENEDGEVLALGADVMVDVLNALGSSADPETGTQTFVLNMGEPPSEEPSGGSAGNWE